MATFHTTVPYISSSGMADDTLFYCYLCRDGCVKRSHLRCGSCLCSLSASKVVNKTRNGTEWNGMEKVNKTRNGTAESARSTPTHPWPTELHPRKLFVHAERFARSFSWKRMGRQADYLFHSIY